MLIPFRHFIRGMSRARSSHEHQEGSFRTGFNLELDLLTRLSARRESTEYVSIATIGTGDSILEILEHRFDDEAKDSFLALVDDSGTRKMMEQSRTVGGSYGAWAELADITVDDIDTDTPKFLPGELAVRLLPRGRSDTTPKVQWFRRYSANVSRFAKTATAYALGQAFIQTEATLPETDNASIVVRQAQRKKASDVSAVLRQGVYRYLAVWILDDGQATPPKLLGGEQGLYIFDDITLDPITSNAYRRGITGYIEIDTSTMDDRCIGMHVFRAAAYDPGYEIGEMSPFYYLATIMFDGSSKERIITLTSSTVSDEGGGIKKVLDSEISDAFESSDDQLELEMDGFCVSIDSGDEYYHIDSSDVDASWVKFHDPDDDVSDGAHTVHIWANCPGKTPTANKYRAGFFDGFVFGSAGDVPGNECTAGVQDLSIVPDVYDFLGLPQGFFYAEVIPEVGCFVGDRFIGANLAVVQKDDSVKHFPHHLIAAESLQPEIMPLTNQFVLDYDGGMTIKEVEPIRSGVLVLKETSFCLVGVQPSTVGIMWALGDIVYSDGLEAIHSLWGDGNNVFWAGKHSIWMYRDGVGVIRIGKPIEPLWQLLTDAERQAAAGFYDVRLDRYIISVPLSTTTVDDILPTNLGLTLSWLSFEFYMPKPEMERPAAWLITDRHFTSAVRGLAGEFFSHDGTAIDEEDASSSTDVTALLELGMPLSLGSMLINDVDVLGAGNKFKVLVGNDDGFRVTDMRGRHPKGEWAGYNGGVHLGNPRVIVAVKGSHDDTYIDDVVVNAIPSRSQPDGA